MLFPQGKYQMMKDLHLNIDKQLAILKLQQCENYISMITAKKALYGECLLGFTNIRKICEEISSYISDLKDKKITKRQKDTRKNCYDIMVENIYAMTGIKPKNLTDVIFYYDGTKIEVYFNDLVGIEFRLSFPDIREYAYTIDAESIDIVYGYDKLIDHMTHLLDSLDFKLSIVEGSDPERKVISLKKLASFPDDQHTMEEFKEKVLEYFNGEKNY